MAKRKKKVVTAVREKYEVHVTRSEHKTLVLTVSAEDVETARVYAVEKAANMVFPRGEADYNIEGVYDMDGNFLGT